MDAAVVNLLLSATVGAVTAMLATYLALKRFRAEKLWEKKVDAYTQLIGAAHEMKRTRDAELDALAAGDNDRKEYGKKLWTESHDAKRLIFRLSDAASFLISEEIERATHELKAALEFSLQSDSWAEIMKKERIALDAYLRRIKDVARKELRR